MNRRTIRYRHGATLLEVLFATVVLLVSIAALSAQIAVGVRSANRINLQSISVSICRSVLAEHIATREYSNLIKPVEGQTDWIAQVKIDPFVEENAFLATCHREQMILISVTVWQRGRFEAISKTTLSQFVRKQSHPIVSGTLREP